MTTRWGLSYISHLAKKHLDVFDKQVVFKLSVLTTIIAVVIVILALIF